MKKIDLGKYTLRFYKSASTVNGNGWISWNVSLAKKLGSGDDGTRSLQGQSAVNKLNK